MLRWEAPAGQRSFSVYRRQYPTPHYDRLATVASHSYIEKTAMPGVTYGYLVVPVGNDGRLGMDRNEFSTVKPSLFMEFVKGTRRKHPVEGLPYATVVAFEHVLQLGGGAKEQQQ